MSAKKEYFNLIVLIAALAAGIAAGMFLFPREKIIEKPAYAKTTRIDTVFAVKRAKPITIYKTKMKVVEVRDTVVERRPYIAKIDTVIVRDTVSARYEFPENLLSLDVRRAADTSVVERIIVFRYVKKERSWTESATLAGGGVLLGVLLAAALK